MDKQKMQEEQKRLKEQKIQEEQKKQEYAEYVKEVTPKNNLAIQMIKAFVVGGIICVIGQVILNVAQQDYGLDKDTAGSWCAMLLVLASAIDRLKSVSETGEIWRGRSAGAYHGLCQFGGFHGYRVPEGGAGLRDRL